MAFKRSFTVLFLLAASVFAVPHNGDSSSHPSKGSSPKGGKNSCKQKEFWYEPKKCCLPHGGLNERPKPPPKKSCPSTEGWYWHPTYSCCVPKSSNLPPPQCSKGWIWDKATQCCEPHGSPTTPSKPSPKPKSPHGSHGGHDGGKKSGHGGYNPPGKGGHNKRHATPLCPHSFEACPIGGLIGSEYECLDTTAELQSCGGCASTGKGQDCTAIEGAWNVGCETGSCAVYTCALGYKVAKDAKSCVKI